MLDAIQYELRHRADYLEAHRIETLYFGGGTPTVYSPAEIQTIIDAVNEVYGNPEFTEITLEANPEDLTGDYLGELSNTAVNRLSIGVQSFHDRHLKFFNRRHNGKTACDSVITAKKYGFGNINIDLIYGIPGMTKDEWELNLRMFAELDVPHLSAYHLSIEDRTIFGKRRKKGTMPSAPEEDSVAQYRMLERVASEFGYEHYEVSNFAHQGMRAVHNSNYWKGEAYMGIGPSAHSFDGVNERRWNIASNNVYLNNFCSGSYFETERLSQDDLYNEFVMTSLRTADGVNIDLLEEKFGRDKAEQFMKIFNKLNIEGVMVRRHRNFVIMPENFLLSDRIISEFFIV